MGRTRAIWRQSSAPIEPPAPVTSTTRAAQVGADAVDLDAHGLAAEHVLDLHLAHLAQQVDAAREQLEDGRQRAHRDPALAAGGHDLLAQDARGRGDRDDHLVGLGVVEHAWPARRSCRAPCSPPTRMPCLRGSSSTKPTAALPQLRVAAQLEGHLLAAVAGADDQHLARGALEQRAAQRALDRGAHEEARAADEREREQEVERDHAARRVGVAEREQEEEADQQEARDDDGLDDRLEVALVDEAPELRVEAEQREDHELDRDRRRRSSRSAGPRSGPGCRRRSAATNAR